MKTIIKVVLAVLTGSRACSRSAKRTSLFFSFLIAAFVLSMVPTVQAAAQMWNSQSHYSEGLKDIRDDNGKYGFIDETGKVVIPCKWRNAWSFSEGMARVEDDNGKRGFI